jgi:glycosyltransferase involved in cell wall biosynthesis
MRGRRITLLPVDDERGASTRYRVSAMLPFLADAGWECELRRPLGNREGRPAPRVVRALDLMQDLLQPVREDLLFIHRKTYPPPLASLLPRRSRALVYDMDDALDLPPPGPEPGDAVRRRYRANFEATVNRADLVLCGNRELAARLPHDRFVLLPTALDTERFAPHAIEPPRGKALGWVGHADNLAYLEALADPLRELARRHPGLRIVVVADRRPELPGLEVEFRRWTLEREVSCFSGIAVGLMPLRDSPWARGKCAFKAIQYMALGRPAVVSPVGMNREVVKHGENGFLADSDEEWLESLDRLLSDPDLAVRMGAAGRRDILRDYALEVVARKLVGLLDEVVAARRAGRTFL